MQRPHVALTKGNLSWGLKKTITFSIVMVLMFQGFGLACKILDVSILQGIGLSFKNLDDVA